MVHADWIVKYSTESNAYLFVKWIMSYMHHVSAPKKAGFCGVKYHRYADPNLIMYGYNLLHSSFLLHCDLQNINCILTLILNLK